MGDNLEFSEESLHAKNGSKEKKFSVDPTWLRSVINYNLVNGRREIKFTIDFPLLIIFASIFQVYYWYITHGVFTSENFFFLMHISSNQDYMERMDVPMHISSNLDYMARRHVPNDENGAYIKLNVEISAMPDNMHLFKEKFEVISCHNTTL